jgi:hypothetical protein
VCLSDLLQVAHLAAVAMLVYRLVRLQAEVAVAYR